VSSQCGHSRVEFADPHARYGRGDRLVGSADFGRGIWLQIPSVEMTGTAAEQDEDARFLGRPIATLRINASRHETGEAQAQRTGPGKLEESATRDRAGGVSPGVGEGVDRISPAEW